MTRARPRPTHRPARAPRAGCVRAPATSRRATPTGGSGPGLRARSRPTRAGRPRGACLRGSPGSAAGPQLLASPESRRVLGRTGDPQWAVLLRPLGWAAWRYGAWERRLWRRGRAKREGQRSAAGSDPVSAGPWRRPGSPAGRGGERRRPWWWWAPA